MSVIDLQKQRDKASEAIQASRMKRAVSTMIAAYTGEGNFAYAKIIEDAFDSVPDESLATLYRSIKATV